MSKLTNEDFILKLRNKENFEEKEKANLKIIIKLYKNCFLVKTENNFEKHFSFKSKKNIEIFERIKQGMFPLKIIKESKIKIPENCNLCLILEDYIEENYFYLDNNFETIEIVIKLNDGKTLKKKFNPFHTINDIKESIENETSLKYNEYTFIHGFPPKEILQEDHEKTIIELGLINSTLIQRKL